MELTPHEQMAIAMSTNPGSYALLLGSGISRSAGIPTGWDIVLTLIRQVAALRQAEPPADPERWYLDEFGALPRFGDILGLLRLTSEERRQVLVPFIEGEDADDSMPAFRQPTPAHRAIASLSSKGYVRLIITTNIDRLLETALLDASVSFDLISSEGGFEGAKPVHETKCLVAKLHGDYKEEGVRLTADELQQYPEATIAFLQEHLPQFGLLVCGWSGEWDVALKEALLGSPCRRYSSFWLSLPPAPSEPAAKIVSALGATTVIASGADEVFPKLYNDTCALKRSKQSHPTSVQLVVDNIRRHADQNEASARLESLLHGETEQLHEALLEEGTNWDGKRMQFVAAFQERIQRCEALVERMVAVVSTVAFYCEAQGPRLLNRLVARIGSLPELYTPGGLSRLHRYPVLLLVYAIGIAALAGQRHRTLYSILMTPELWDGTAQQWTDALALINSSEVFDQDDWDKLPLGHVGDAWLRPSIHISKVLQPLVLRYTGTPNEHERLFDVFEFLQSLVHHAEYKPRLPLLGPFANCSDYFIKGDLPRGLKSPIGRYYERQLWGGRARDLLSAGFFDGNADRMGAALHAHRTAIAEINANPRLGSGNVEHGT